MSALVDRKRLLTELQFRSKDSDNKFSWGYQLAEPTSLMQSFYVNEIGGNVTIPVSHQTAEILRKISSHVAHTQGLDYMNFSAGNFLHINQTKIMASSSESFMQTSGPNLIKLVTRHLLGFEVDMLSNKIEIRLTKLVMVEKGQAVKFNCGEDSKPGTFAIMAILLPVEGGFRGGRINVQQSGRSETFDFQKNSDRCFSIIAFFSNCQHNMAPVTDGWMATMVFHLVWLDALEISASASVFPTFFKAFYQVSDCLVSWNSSFQIDKDESLEAPYINSNDNSSEPHPTVETQLKNELGKEILLFVPLEEKYGNTQLSFSKLRGRDLLVAQLFQSIHFLDVHIVVISQLVDGNLDPFVDWEKHSNWTDRTFQIARWIGSRNSLPLLKELSFDARTQLVGNISRIQNVAKGPDGALNHVLYYHAVLVIQPRFQSILNGCRHQFEDVLKHMEIQLLHIMKFDQRPIAQHQLLDTLRQVISFCWAEPLLTWMNPDPATNDRSRRLLKICIQLRAKKDGLDFLKLLATKFKLNRMKTSQDVSKSALPDMFTEGIRNEKAAKAVADFVTRISGWDNCADLVLLLISPLRIFRQLACYSNLAQYLFDRDCIEGARAVADRISSIVTKLTVPQTNFLIDYQINSYVDLVITFEENSLIANSSRVESVVSLFNRLAFQRQCHFVIGLQSHCRLRMKNVETCRQLVKNLCGCLNFSSHPNESISVDVILPLIKSYVQFGDTDMLQVFIEKLTGIKPNSKEFPTNDTLIYSIFSSPDTLEVVQLSELGKTTVYNLLDAGIKQLEEEMSVLQNQEGHHLLSKLVSCFRLVLRINVDPKSIHCQQMLLSIGFLLFNLPTERLCDLILEIQKLDEELVVNCETSYILYLDLCRLLSLRDKESVAKLSKRKTVEILELIIWLDDFPLAQSFVHRINLNDGWNQEDKNSFLDVIVSCKDLLDILIPASSVFVLDMVENVIETLVVKITRRLEVIKSDSNLVPTTNCNGYTVDELDTEIAFCVSLYIRNEKEYPHDSQYGVQLFCPVFDKLSAWRLSHLLASIFQTEIDEHSSLVEFSSCFKFCYLIASQFVSRDLNVLLKSNSEIVVDTVVNATVRLLWLGEDQPLLTLVRKICSSFPPWQENAVVSKIVLSSQAREIAANCQSSRKAFCMLLEQRINRLKMMKARESAMNKSTTSCSEQVSFNNILNQLEEMRLVHRSLQDQFTLSKDNTTSLKRINHGAYSDNFFNEAEDDSIDFVNPIKRERKETPTAFFSYELDNSLNSVSDNKIS